MAGSCSDSDCGPEIRSGKSGNPAHLTCEYPPHLFSSRRPGRPPNQLSRPYVDTARHPIVAGEFFQQSRSGLRPTRVAQGLEQHGRCSTCDPLDILISCLSCRPGSSRWPVTCRYCVNGKRWPTGCYSRARPMGALRRPFCLPSRTR